MTNQDKSDLISACKHGWDIDDIRDTFDCCDTTIRKYLKLFSNLKLNKKGNNNDRI